MSPQPVILVIDDVLENVAVLGAALAQVAQVQFATSGQEGLGLARRNAPDLILLDVMMPDMDGFEVCERLQQAEATRAIPVIFVTARTDAASESRGLALGAVDFIHKPLRPDLVQALGINVPVLITATYAVGSALAAFAGVLAAPIFQVNPVMGSNLIIVVFAVVVIGGMGSILGSIVTGLGLGLIEGLTKVVYPEASAVVIFLIMVIVLLLRPAGLFGKQA